MIGTYPPSTPIAETIVEGEPLKLLRQELKTYPEPTFSWAIAETEVDTNPKVVLPSKRVMIDGDGMLFKYIF